MFTLHPQYVVDENQQRKAVLVPLAEWELIIEDLEELEDVRAYDKAKAGSQDSVSFDQTVREMVEGDGA